MLYSSVKQCKRGICEVPYFTQNYYSIAAMSIDKVWLNSPDTLLAIETAAQGEATSHTKKVITNLKIQQFVLVFTHQRVCTQSLTILSLLKVH